MSLVHDTDDSRYGLPEAEVQDIQHLSPRELAKRWQLSVNTLERWRDEDIGPAFFKVKRRILYPIADIETYETVSRRIHTPNQSTTPTQNIPHTKGD